MNIREMDIADYNEVEALWLKSEGIGLHDQADSLTGIASYLERNPGLSFVAVHDRKIIGAVLCGHDGLYGFLHHLAVEKDYRGQGIGTMLVLRSMESLRAKGIHECNIFLLKDNQEGKKFWEKMQWKLLDHVYIFSKEL